MLLDIDTVCRALRADGYGMTTDVYPQDNCIAPDIAVIEWTTNVADLEI